MFAYALSRLVQMIPTVLGIYVLTFFMMRVLPSDPAKFIEGDRGDAQSLAETRARLRLDEPLSVQFTTFITSALQGDLGRSFIHNRPVSTMVGESFQPTAVLAIAATAIAVVLGIPLGIISAVRRNSVWDFVARLVALIGVSIPVFWLGIQLQILFAVNLKWLDPTGSTKLSHLIMPAIAASFGMLAVLTRITRSSLLEVLGQDYVRTAHSKGLPSLVVFNKHALRNALLPVVTVWGATLASLLSGTILVETIFAWPGMGRLLVAAIGQRDYPLVQGIVITYALVYATLNLIVDLLYPLIDPRIRYS
jgi:ABC-type dipeptide/oligopeptide/nickel transport system permease component